MEFNLDKEDLENQIHRLRQTIWRTEVDSLQRLPLRTLGAGTIEDPTFIGRTPHREEQQCHRDTPSEEGTGFSPQSHDRLYQPDWLAEPPDCPTEGNHSRCHQEVQRRFPANQQLVRREEEPYQDRDTCRPNWTPTNISVQPTNKRGKTAKKVKDIVKFKINFSIVKNITAETGERTLYIRITKPDNDVLTKSSSNTFPYENRELVYSIKKYIEYNGEEQAVTVYWDVEEYLYAGTYRVDIFADGTLIGSQSFSLN